MIRKSEFRRATGVTSHPVGPSARDKGAHGAPMNAPDTSLLDLGGCLLRIRPLFQGAKHG